jgi:hypothetical protein
VGTDPPVLLSLTGVAVAELPQATINTKANIIATGQYLNAVFLKTCEVDMFNLRETKIVRYFRVRQAAFDNELVHQSCWTDPILYEQHGLRPNSAYPQRVNI